jgi:hypothetical protein
MARKLLELPGIELEAKGIKRGAGRKLVGNYLFVLAAHPDGPRGGQIDGGLEAQKRNRPLARDR